jgi:hypothetical protein
MPAFGEFLGDAKVHLLTAYVYGIGGGGEGSAPAAAPAAPAAEAAAPAHRRKRSKLTQSSPAPLDKCAGEFSGEHYKNIVIR